MPDILASLNKSPQLCQGTTPLVLFMMYLYTLIPQSVALSEGVDPNEPRTYAALSERH
jgi:hypothetical protein